MKAKDRNKIIDYKLKELKSDDKTTSSWLLPLVGIVCIAGSIAIYAFLLTRK